ncbi:unnamed protein product [Coffea canephora]|uniref:CCHC-type domain-containing protein n=1 Tax=Coffea canephora TaxID=49390 RepID=A0A068UDI1_COFCA|nr:unnamed protein product [Coffea canephora]
MNGVQKWISFKYEIYPDFCYSCGIIGHSEKNCKAPMVVKKGQHHNQYGPWMRVFGGRGSPQKESSQKIWTPHKQVWKVRNGEMVRIEEVMNQEKGLGLNQEGGPSKSSDLLVKEPQKQVRNKESLPMVELEKVGRIIPCWSNEKPMEEEQGTGIERNSRLGMKETREREVNSAKITINLRNEENNESQGVQSRELEQQERWAGGFKEGMKGRSNKGEEIMSMETDENNNKENQGELKQQEKRFKRSGVVE